MILPATQEFCKFPCVTVPYGLLGSLLLRETQKGESLEHPSMAHKVKLHHSLLADAITLMSCSAGKIYIHPKLSGRPNTNWSELTSVQNWGLCPNSISTRASTAVPQQIKCPVLVVVVVPVKPILSSIFEAAMSGTGGTYYNYLLLDIYRRFVALHASMTTSSTAAGDVCGQKAPSPVPGGM